MTSTTELVSMLTVLAAWIGKRHAVTARLDAAVGNGANCSVDGPVTDPIFVHMKEHDAIIWGQLEDEFQFRYNLDGMARTAPYKVTAPLEREQLLARMAAKEPVVIDIDDAGRVARVRYAASHSR